MNREDRIERRATAVAQRSNWTFERRRADRRATFVVVVRNRRLGRDRRLGNDRRKLTGSGYSGLSAGRTPITSWLTRRLPDDFIERSGEAVVRIWEIVGEHWRCYDRTSQAELVQALLPLLKDLTESRSVVTENHRERCEVEIVNWLSTHSPDGQPSMADPQHLRKAV